MNLESMNINPFADGFIRVATTTDPATDKIRFDGAFEVLARHHDVGAVQAVSESVPHTPRLAAHPMSAQLKTGVPANKQAGKLVEIPIRMFFNKTSNAITAKYQAYDENGFPACVGNGKDAKRLSSSDKGVNAVSDVPCQGPQTCDYANSGLATCRRQVCMTVQVKDQENPLSVFEVRTSSHNSYKALRGQLGLIEKRFGGLRHVPLKLQLWQASNPSSDFEAFDLMKLNLDSSSEAEAMRAAMKARQDEAESGLIANQDETFEELRNKDAVSVDHVDFNVVRDFYQPRASGATGRRAGSESVAATVAKNAKSADFKTADASSLIGDAVKRAMRTPTPTEREVVHE